MHDPSGPREFLTTLEPGGRGEPRRERVARAALEQLCRAYGYPLYAFVRGRGHAAADAQDPTQAFFAALIEIGGPGGADPGRGRFRSYLLGAMKHSPAASPCRPRRPVGSADMERRGPGFALLALLLLAPACSGGSSKSLRAEEAAIVGRYHCGEKRGLEHVLVLSSSGEYQLTRSGCAGEYGRREGSWSLRDGRIELTAVKREGALESWPETATCSDRRIAFPNDLVLEFWAEDGPAPP